MNRFAKQEPMHIGTRGRIKFRAARLVCSFFFILLPSIFVNFCTAFLQSKSQNSEYPPSISQLLSLVASSPSCNGDGAFWARDLVSNTSYCTQTNLVASGQYINVYAEPSLAGALNYQNIATEFDAQIHPRLEAAFGVPNDLDHNGKVTILVLDIRDGSTPGGSFVAGYFDPADYYPDSLTSRIRSNFRDMLYLDGVQLVALRNKDLANGKPDTFLATMSHEYQHLVRFQYEATALAQGGNRDETWINEGTSEVASDIAGYSPQTARINCYRGNIPGACARGVNGSSIFGSPRYNSVVDYAFSYPFMKYIYLSSGDNTAERDLFFKASVQGIAGIRAVDASSLFEVFRRTSQAYFTQDPIVNSLGSTSGDTFRMIFAAFLWQSIGDTSPDTVQAGTDMIGADALRQSIDSIITRFPFVEANLDGIELQGLYTPSRLPEIVPLPTLSPGQFQLVKLNQENVNASPGLFLMKKSFNGINYSIQVNTEPNRIGDISFSYGKTNSAGDGQGIELPASDSPNPICPHDFLKVNSAPVRFPGFPL
ncbi:peptidase M30 [Leptospira fainei serovar Hurstbridge str. BUT 6]|uniref:Peptidase M30 n=1 Tax=Leptospira fainei serovar Hurstbridge str. BUT 6 TaxID=1193011 RepID=S3VXF9_9LEPT|nr:peptidase M30 [Leptospira fainei]EPG72817.1 peptidase M30 [Leptospira fainei serovar Hurstbridge str. BUT 6]